MPGLPSDQHGTLHSKESGTSFCPRNEASDQENLRRLERMKHAPYRQLLKIIKEILPHLSLHSIRRGAIMALAENFEAEKIIRLTGHTPLIELEARLREYIFPEPTHRLARDQRQMSKYLCMLLEGREIAKVTFTSQ